MRPADPKRHTARSSKQAHIGREPASRPDGFVPVGRELSPVPDVSRSEDIIRVRKKRKKSGKGKKAALIAAVSLVAVFALAGGALALYVNSLDRALSFDDEQQAESLKGVLAPVSSSQADEPFYLLVLGSDAREGDEASRSDVILLTRVDPASGLITMVSIPRDTMVELPGHGRQKINAAYAFDGASGAVQAASSFAHVPIAHVAEIHFQELESLVDMLGGVWVDVPVSNDETGASNTGATLSAGEQLLDGAQALTFARERYGYLRGDFQRADNQRILAEAIVKKALDSSPLDLPGIVQQLASCVSTDLAIGDIVGLAQNFQSSGATFYSALAPSSTMMLDDVSYVVTDYAAWTEMMRRVEAGQDPNAADAAAGSSDAAATDPSAAAPAGGDGSAC